MTQQTRTTWWLVENYETRAGFTNAIVQVRTWEQDGVRVDTPERVFLDVDNIPMAAYAEGHFSQYAQDVLAGMSNEKLAELRVTGRALELPTEPPEPT